MRSSRNHRRPDDPNGMTTDKAGNLYVTDIGVATEGPAAGRIKIYPKGSTSIRG